MLTSLLYPVSIKHGTISPCRSGKSASGPWGLVSLCSGPGSAGRPVSPALLVRGHSQGPLLLDSNPHQHCPKLFPLKATEAPSPPVLPGIHGSTSKGSLNSTLAIWVGDDPLVTQWKQKDACAQE